MLVYHYLMLDSINTDILYHFSESCFQSPVNHPFEQRAQVAIVLAYLVLRQRRFAKFQRGSCNALGTTFIMGVNEVIIPLLFRDVREQLISTQDYQTLYVRLALLYPERKNENHTDHDVQTVAARINRHKVISVISLKSCITGWWFGTCLYFPYIGNNHPN